MSVTSALKALRERYPGHLGNVWSVQINESDSSQSIEMICNSWNAAVSRGGTAVPDLVLDVTIDNLGAEASSSFTAVMGVPTLSAQYGQKDDIRHWRDLNNDQANYLIQVSIYTREKLKLPMGAYIKIRWQSLRAAVLYIRYIETSESFRKIVIKIKRIYYNKIEKVVRFPRDIFPAYFFPAIWQFFDFQRNKNKLFLEDYIQLSIRRSLKSVIVRRAFIHVLHIDPLRSLF